MNLRFLPDLPLTLSYPLLFGVLLVAGMLGGEVARHLRLPRLVGYVLVGFAIAPVAAAMNIGPLLDEARIFVDIGLGLVLFDLGRRMDIAWLKRDWTLAASGVAESLLSFGLVFAALSWLGIAPLMAGLAAAIAMATSPAVVLLIAQDTRAEGQVTERALTLVALNSLLASVVVTMLTASVHYEVRLDLDTAVLHPALPVRRVAGARRGHGAGRARCSRARSSAARSCTSRSSRASSSPSVGLAQMGKLSVILALLAFGMFARNDAHRHDLVNVDLGPRLAPLLHRALRDHGSEPAAFLVRGRGVGRASPSSARARRASSPGVLRVRAASAACSWRQAVGLGAALLPMSVARAAPASRRRAALSRVRAAAHRGRARGRDRDGARSGRSPPSGDFASRASPRPCPTRSPRRAPRPAGAG